MSRKGPNRRPQAPDRHRIRPRTPKLIGLHLLHPCLCHWPTFFRIRTFEQCMFCSLSSSLCTDIDGGDETQQYFIKKLCKSMANDLFLVCLETNKPKKHRRIKYIQLRYDSTPETTGNHTTINQYAAARRIKVHVITFKCIVSTVVNKIKLSKLRSYTTW